MFSTFSRYNQKKVQHSTDSMAKHFAVELYYQISRKNSIKFKLLTIAYMHPKNDSFVDIIV